MVYFLDKNKKKIQHTIKIEDKEDIKEIDKIISKYYKRKHKRKYIPVGGESAID